MTNVCKTYDGKIYALYDVTLHIERGEFVFLVGPSGAGKSTFIKLLFREIKPEKGSIFVNGVDIVNLSNDKVPDLRRMLGIVFQDYRLLTDRTVFDNVAFAMRVTEAPTKFIKPRVLQVLDYVGLADKVYCKSTELSGGEQQRVAIARAIVNDPKLIIADEPTGNLDHDTAMEIMNIFEKIQQSGATIIMATHSQDIVNEMGKRVIAVNNGQIVRDERRGRYDG